MDRIDVLLPRSPAIAECDGVGGRDPTQLQLHRECQLGKAYVVPCPAGSACVQMDDGIQLVVLLHTTPRSWTCARLRRVELCNVLIRCDRVVASVARGRIRMHVETSVGLSDRTSYGGNAKYHAMYANMSRLSTMPSPTTLSSNRCSVHASELPHALTVFDREAPLYA